MHTTLEIETTTTCNWRCDYCPVATMRKPAKVMSMDLFNEILQKAVEHPTIKRVSFNSYNEPTIDPFFDERLEALSKTRLQLMLSTNGTGLTDARIKRLGAPNLLNAVIFNLPTLNPVKFKALTGSSDLVKVLATIDKCIDEHLEVEIYMNGTTEETTVNIAALVNRYKARLKYYGITNDKAGLLRNRYENFIQVNDPLLYGCSFLDRLYVSVQGDFFLCCNDYLQKIIYGNIKDGTMEQITSSPRAKELFARVNGETEAPADFLCRKCVFMAYACTMKRTKDETKKDESPIKN